MDRCSPVIKCVTAAAAKTRRQSFSIRPLRRLTPPPPPHVWWTEQNFFRVCNKPPSPLSPPLSLSLYSLPLSPLSFPLPPLTPLLTHATSQTFLGRMSHAAAASTAHKWKGGKMAADGFGRSMKVKHLVNIVGILLFFTFSIFDPVKNIIFSPLRPETEGHRRSKWSRCGSFSLSYSVRSPPPSPSP